MAEEVKTKTEEKIPVPHVDWHNHKKKMMLAGGVFLVFIAVGAVAAGVAFKHFEGNSRVYSISNNRMMSGNIHGNFDGRNGMMGRGNVLFGAQTTGKVTAVDGKTFTVDASGTSLKVQITDTTRFPLKSATSVVVNDQVIVSGEKDSNGVIQATRIIVNPTTLTEQPHFILSYF